MQQIQMVEAVYFITVTWINKNGHPEPGRVVVTLRKMRENILANPALVKCIPKRSRAWVHISAQNPPLVIGDLLSQAG